MTFKDEIQKLTKVAERKDDITQMKKHKAQIEAESNHLQLLKNGTFGIDAIRNTIMGAAKAGAHTTYISLYAWEKERPFWHDEIIKHIIYLLKEEGFDQVKAETGEEVPIGSDPIVPYTSCWAHVTVSW